MKLCGGGCRRAIPDDAKRCDECNAECHVAAPSGERTHTTGYTDELDAQRKTARWQKRRAEVIKKQPFCARCEVSLSEIVDHIVPAPYAIEQARASGKYPYDKYAGYYLITNLQGLCRPCHGLKTNEDKAHVGPWPDIMEAEANKPRKVWSF